jgi:hypothetical protein
MFFAAATFPPSEADAQRGFVAAGAGVSRIRPHSSFGLESATRPSLLARGGIGGGRFQLVLDWQTHGLGDQEPLTTDYQNGVFARTPQVLRTDFLMLGAQVHFGRFYVRPALGVSSNKFAVYFVPGDHTESADVSQEGGLAAGLSAGYRLKVSSRFSLALEASALQSGSEDSTGDRTVIGFQVIPLLEF